jgi:pilus assembly protein CpaC
MFQVSSRTRLRALLSLCAIVSLAHIAVGQSPDNALTFDVNGPTQRLEMIVNTSRILTLDKKIPRLQVNNPDIVSAQPLSPYKVQLAALRPGVTQVNLWDENEKIYTVDVLILGDARELQMLLESEFPNSALKVRPLASSVVISGFVDRPESVSRIVRMAEDYYPKIINNITVGGVQQVLLHVKVMEVSRSKLRTMGIDWANFNGNDFISSRPSGILAAPEVNIGTGVNGQLVASADTIRFGIVDGSNAFFGFLEALRAYNLAKLLAEPTLVTVSGRPASFNVGGEFPILVPGGLGTVSIEYKQFGTRVDFVPIVLGNGNIRLEVRPAVTERDDASGVNGVPAIRTRWVDTAAEMKAGQTLALAGLVQQQTESSNVGVPLVSDLPWIGAAFRRVEHRINEVELLVMVTPELVGPMDPHQVPHCLPGQFTTDPCDSELYGRGYLEVPKCCEGGSLSCNGGHAYHGGCVGCGNGQSSMPYYEGAVYGEPSPSLGTPSMNNSQLAPPSDSTRNGPQRLPATPASYRNDGRRSANQYNPSESQNRSGRPSTAAANGRPQANSQPSLIGPLGYDVLD